MTNTIQFNPTDAEITDVQQEKNITLEDLAENWKEKIANLSDKKIQELKQKAIEEENYDIAKLIKIEQEERKEKAKEAEEKIKEEEKKHEEIQEKITFSHKENLGKAQELITKLNKNEKNIESKISEISDDEILFISELIHIVAVWSYKNNNRILEKLWDYPTEKDVPQMRKYIEEHPEEWITDKKTYYEKAIEEIAKLVKESDKGYDNKWITSWNRETMENILKWINTMEDIIKWLSILADKMRDAGMEESEAYKKGEEIYYYSYKKREEFEKDLNLFTKYTKI